MITVILSKEKLMENLYLTNYFKPFTLINNNIFVAIVKINREE